jgi:hypothetical protein
LQNVTVINPLNKFDYQTFGHLIAFAMIMPMITPKSPRAPEKI